LTTFPRLSANRSRRPNIVKSLLIPYSPARNACPTEKNCKRLPSILQRYQHRTPITDLVGTGNASVMTFQKGAMRIFTIIQAYERKKAASERKKAASNSRRLFSCNQ
jgi:hypothetical protein